MQFIPYNLKIDWSYSNIFIQCFFSRWYYFTTIFTSWIYFIYINIIISQLMKTIYFLNTYKSYDFFLSQPPLAHIITYCTITSNSHCYLIHNIFNSCHLFTFRAFITSKIYCTSIHISPLSYWEIFSIYIMSIFIIYNLSYNISLFLYLQDMLKSFFFFIKFCR